jgi:proteasome lid subunit RPN8/RPN11
MSEKSGPAEGVGATQWKDRGKAVRRTFPGPPGAMAPLRVALSRAAYGDLAGHAKESLEAEVAGILAGQLCEDDDGHFLDVQAVVRAEGARQGRGHVTFTQESWNGIHAAMERDHPKLQIVGWYHTHPGFGVEFSEMDVFIQRNFFSQPWQVALLTDPLGGDMAAAVNGEAALVYLDRFWVEGREQRCRLPASAQGGGEAPAASAQLEARVAQLTAAVHELRQTVRHTITAAAVAVVLVAGLTMAYAWYRIWLGSVRPPENIAFVPVPVTIDGRPVLIGLGVVKWEIPRELLVPEERAAPAAGPAATATPAPSPEAAR